MSPELFDEIHRQVFLYEQANLMIPEVPESGGVNLREAMACADLKHEGAEQMLMQGLKKLGITRDEFEEYYRMLKEEEASEAQFA